MSVSAASAPVADEAVRLVRVAVERYGASHVARLIDVSETAVRGFVKGTKRPSASTSSRIAVVFAQESEPTTSSAAPASSSSSMRPVDELRALVDSARKISELAAKDRNAPTRDRVAAANLYRAALRDLLAATDIDEQRMVESPKFQRAMTHIIEALRPYPDALRAVLERLREVVEGEYGDG